MNHLIGDLGQVQYFTHQNILSKPNDPREAPRDVNPELSDHATQAIDQLCALPHALGLERHQMRRARLSGQRSA